jgi:recombinational DNA repair protein (RecF pathway)
VNFRASSFSFLYRVLYADVPLSETKDALDSVWIPNGTWRAFLFEVLEENGVDPDCDACLWSED